MERYDRAITIFSPDGHLFQVEYANEAVKKGSTAVGVRGKNCVVIGVEKKTIPTLQDDRTVRKIHMIDDHIMLAFAGLSADARVLVDRARMECQSYKLRLEDPVTVHYISRYVADTKQANSTGRGEKAVREFLEEKYNDENVQDEAATLKLVVKALSQVVPSGASNIEIAVMTSATGKPGECHQRVLTTEEVDGLLKVVEAERQATEAEEAARKEAARTGAPKQQ
ncbi:unnamed protein product, partial [Mesorhabditis spiculigera]